MSNVPKIKRRCVFCGVGQVSNEHVFPEWIVLLLKKNLAFEKWRSTRPDVPPWETPELRVTVKQVCERCNNEWMSQLEDETIPILTPLLLSDRLPILLSIEQQKTLATWSYKTALMASLIEKKERVRGGAYTAFYSRRVPPEQCVILIAAHDGTDSVSLTLRTGHMLIRREAQLLRRVKKNFHVITFSIYRVVFQVILYYGSVLPHKRFANVVSTEVIWPPKAPVSWPPNRSAFSDEGLRDLANRPDWRRDMSL